LVEPPLVVGTLVVTETGGAFFYYEPQPHNI